MMMTMEVYEMIKIIVNHEKEILLMRSLRFRFLLFLAVKRPNQPPPHDKDTITYQQLLQLIQPFLHGRGLLNPMLTSKWPPTASTSPLSYFTLVSSVTTWSRWCQFRWWSPLTLGSSLSDGHERRIRRETSGASSGTVRASLTNRRIGFANGIILILQNVRLIWIKIIRLDHSYTGVQ